MGLLVAVLCIAVIALAVLLFSQRNALWELRSAHVKLATEVGTVRREAGARSNDLLPLLNREIREVAASRSEVASYILESIDPIKAYAATLNERLVLLEIEKPPKPPAAEDPAPSRRSFASQKARAEAGARK